MNVCTLSDKELIADYIQGNQAAFEELFMRHKMRVFTYIMMMVRHREQAEDIFQETFIKVINTLKSGRYNEEGKFLPWVLRIAHNIVIDQYRKTRKLTFFRGGKENVDDFDIFAIIGHSEKSPEERLFRIQTDERIHRLIRMLPEEQKEVLLMRVYAGLSFNEISDQTQVSINTALGRMRYALINLRKLIRRFNLEMDI